MFMTYSPPARGEARRLLSRQFKPQRDGELNAWLRYMFFLAGDDPQSVGVFCRPDDSDDRRRGWVSLGYYFGAQGKLLVLLQDAPNSEQLFKALAPRNCGFLSVVRKRALVQTFRAYSSLIQDACRVVYGQVLADKRKVHGGNYSIGDESECLVVELTPSLLSWRR